MKVRYLNYTEIEIDTDTQQSRVIKHWSKVLNMAYKKKAPAVEITAQQVEDEYL